MGTEVLRPQDCLIQRIRVAPAGFNRRKTYYPNGNTARLRKVGRPEQKRRFNAQPEMLPPATMISKRSASPEYDLRKSNHQIVMEQVTILRRGESLDAKVVKADRPVKKISAGDLVVVGTERLGPDPEMVTKQIRIGDLKSALSPVAAGGSCRTDMYAGSAFSMSPSPRALPLPSFFNKKQVSNVVEDSATRDLRRLLRLD